MGRNGKHAPRRPRIEVRQSAASPEEAAAIAAAIEQFLRDTTPPPAAQTARPNPWARAATLSAAGYPAAPDQWGDGQPWGAAR